jgi:hypothetical protein
MTHGETTAGLNDKIPWDFSSPKKSSTAKHAKRAKIFVRGLAHFAVNFSRCRNFLLCD